MGLIKFDVPILKKSVSLNPDLKYFSECQLSEFPDIEYHTDVSPIFHFFELVISFDHLEMKVDLNDEIEVEIKKNFNINEESNEIVIARLRFTEFPSNWKEEMQVSWGYWLDAYDGDHQIIGVRADEIEDEGIFEDVFDEGSLFYLEHLEVHEMFRGNRIGISLVKYALKHLSRNNKGMVLLIANPIDNELSGAPNKYTNSANLARYYEQAGFNKVKKIDRKAILMELELERYKYFE